jgi:hypothetical protein
MSVFENLGKKEEGLEKFGITLEKVKAIVQDPESLRKLLTMLFTLGVFTSFGNANAETPNYKGITRAGDVGSVEPGKNKKAGEDSTTLAPGWGQKGDFHDVLSKDLEGMGKSGFLKLEDQITALQSAQRQLEEEKKIIEKAQEQIKEDLKKIEGMGSRPEVK